MVAQEEHVEAKALKAQGWSISAIARHLGRDRKTIRASLRARRAPDTRKRSTDPFARFAPYTAQRFKDDPHLQLSTLIRELRALGFAASYQTFTREVRTRSLRPHCEACAGVKGRATIDIEHDPGHETQWDWLELTETPWGETAYVQVGALAHSGKFRGSFSPSKDSGHLIAAMQEVIRGLDGLTKRFRIDAMEGAVVPGTRAPPLAASSLKAKRRMVVEDRGWSSSVTTEIGAAPWRCAKSCWRTIGPTWIGMRPS